MDKMNVAFYSSLNDEEFRSQRDFLTKSFSDNWTLHFQNDNSEKSTFQKLESFLQHSKTNSIDICLVSLSPFRIVDKDVFTRTLSDLSEKKKAIAFRLGSIKGVDFTYPPKMPLIEPSLIIFFPKNHHTGKRAAYYPHFTQWDGKYFDLYAFVENYFTSDSFIIFDQEEELLNKYGEKDGFSFDGFTYSPTTSIVTYPEEPSYEIISIKNRLLDKKGQGAFLERNMLFLVYNSIKKSLMKLMRKNELVKKYDI